MSDDIRDPADDHSGRRSFIRDIIDADLAAGRHEQVVTRFPPEPNGYLHIGHAKSICLNFGLAKDYKGRCHLRFDDTNPLKESVEYVESIKRDVRWLGFDWGEHLYYASDYFDRMYDWAVHLIKEGKAYVCSLSRDEFSTNHRKTVYEVGTPSPYRERSVEENLDLFARMKAGEFSEGEHVLRAAIDMTSPNMLMRDPPIYRIINAAHYRAGDAWHVYPMYDFAHCLEDALEHITHSICTLEFETNRELYDWVLDNLPVPSRPHQYEFARLNLGYTVMSKRKLLTLVEEGHVSGWDDPRMPTIAGLRRRGVTPEAIRAFADMIGVARTNSTVDIDKLEFCIRDDLNHRSPRVMCVLDPLKVVITNYPEASEGAGNSGTSEELEASYWPHDVPKEGTRTVPFGKEIFIERGDFMEDPPKKWHRMALGREVRLRYAYYVTCNEVVRDADGNLAELRCTYDPATRGGTSEDGRKVRGTLHWVSAEHGVKADVRLYDRLFSVEKPDGDPEVDFKTHLNPDSLLRLSHAIIEPSVLSDGGLERYQFERTGYFFRDPVDSTADKPVFNRVVPLKDSWARKTKPEAPVARPKTERAPSKPSGPVINEREVARENNPRLAERFAHYKSLGLTEQDADVLTGDERLVDYYDEALAAHADPKTIARWVINALLRELKDRTWEEIAIEPSALAELARMVEEKEITATVGKELFEEISRTGADPAALVVERDLATVNDEDDLSRSLDGLLEAHPSEVARYRAGEKKLFGFFIGQAMRVTGGKADAGLVRKVLTEKLA